MYRFFTFLFLSISGYYFSQTDSIFLKIKLTEDLEKMYIEQTTVVYNHTDKPLQTMGFHAWMNAYGRRLSPLSQRKLEDRNKNLYFSKKEERGWLKNISSSNNFSVKEDEFVSIDLENPLYPNEKTSFQFQYEVKVPKDFITRYGKNDKRILLKYFILQPVKFYTEEGKPEFVHYIDLETLPVKPTYYDLQFESSEDVIESNIKKIGEKHFKGKILEALVLLINPEHLYTYSINGTDIAVNYNLSEAQKPLMPSVFAQQLKFLQENYALETDKILITFKTKKLQNFTGVDDIKLTNKLFIRFFTQKEQIEMKMFQMLTYEALREHLNIDFEKNHWILHGLLVYMQINYIKTFYPELKLAGHLPEEFHIGGIKPLKWFFASDLNLTDRYKLAYLYVVKQNYEQDITTEYSKFSRINQTIISAFKTGIGFNYISDYLGNKKLNSILKGFLNQNYNTFVSANDFENYINERADKDLSWFFDQFLESSDKLNFSLKKFKQTDDSLKISIVNQTDFQGPFKLVGYKGDSIIRSQWYESKGHKALYNFPLGEYDKLVLNPGYTLAEFNYRDNYIYTTGFFKNSKKVKPKLYADIENPEYEQVFIVPELRFNNYDKVLLGAEFSNYAIFNKQFRYDISPSFSTGTGQITGSANLNYNFLPEKGLFRMISLNSGGSFFHYAENLSYFNLSNSIKFIFKKDPRAPTRNYLSASLQNIDKEPNPNDLEQNPESLHYNLLSFDYFYRNDALIHERRFRTQFELASLFSKLNIEYFHRWEFARNRKLTLRLFSSYMFKNHAQTDYFDTSISRIADYSFDYNLLARSDDSGFLSQQYVMAEGGFISGLNSKTNQFITSFHTEFPIFKYLLLFGDAGVYKNRGLSAKFIYDSGVKLRLIPDFFELYFPIQSSLGFEPKLDSYGKRIRFTFNLNLSALVRYFERGWY